MTASNSVAEPSGFLAELLALLGPARVSLLSEDLETYSHDLWPRFLLAADGGQGLKTRSQPLAVAWPESAAEVQAVMRLCQAHGVALVPYGAGSGVAGGAAGPAGSLVLDLKRMRAVEIDAERGVVSFEPGILGWHLEERLNRRGLSLGHFPSSIMCSTAGGWLATRGAGQMSTKYGKIEDMVRSLELCTGAGELLHCDNGDRGGADWVQLAVGSEGTLGVITRATCAVRPLPATRRLRGFSFPNVEAACQAIQHLMQAGMRPAVVRLYDEIDTLISGMGRATKKGTSLPFSQPIDEVLALLQKDARRLKSRVERWLVQALLGETEPLTRLVQRLLEKWSPDTLLVLGFEGELELVDAEDAYARERLASYGGRELGEEPGQHWLRHRYDVSFKMSRAFMAGAFTDTIEVATTWDRLLPLYRAVRSAVSPYAVCMAHFSHAYPDGCSIYFTVLSRRRGDKTLPAGQNRAAIAEDEQRYDALWRAALQATLQAGATISHHHGVGRLKAPFMYGEHGDSLRILSALRTACDPHRICNPGNLAPFIDAKTQDKPLPASPAEQQVSSANLLFEAACELRLFELEQTLQKDRLSLGGLPPWAFGRTLKQALTAPRPSEASLQGGRLRDRRARLRARFSDGRELYIPPRVVPRRATGPDLGQALLGQQEDGIELLSATLRLLPWAPEPQWVGYLFERPAPAVQALFAARAMHGATSVAELLLINRGLLTRVLDAAALPPVGEWALLLRPCGPEPVATATLQILEARIDKSACGRLSAAQCREFWTPEALCGKAASAESVAAVAAKFPQHEQALSLAHSSPAQVAATLVRAGGNSLLCGVYLHGLTLCTERPLPQEDHPAVRSASQAPLEAEAADAAAVLRPRLWAALQRS